MTYLEVQNKINLNLADFSNISAEKHREVEQALLDYIQDNLPLYRGSFVVGDVAGSDQIFNINFPNVGTSDYYVKGSFRSNSIDFNNDNDITWVFRETTGTSFRLGVREFGGGIQNLTFYYELKKI